MCVPQVRLSLFKYRPIALKQLHGLTTIDTFSWLGGPKVTHQTGVRVVLDSIRGSGKGYNVFFFCFVVVFCFYCPKHIIYYTKCISFCKSNLRSILKIIIAKNIIRVLRYRPSTFNNTIIKSLNDKKRLHNPRYRMTQIPPKFTNRHMAGMTHIPCVR